MLRNERRPIAFFFDITFPFATKTDSRLEPVDCIRTYLYEISKQMLARPEVHSWHQYTFAGSITMVFASGIGLFPGQPQLRGKRRFERPRRGTDDQGRAARMRNGGTVGRLRRLGQVVADEMAEP
jgi:hypothetical protein